MVMNELVEYDHVETVKARRLADTGEFILTTKHGGVTVYGGYLVERNGGISSEYWDTESFEAYWDVVPVED